MITAIAIDDEANALGVLELLSLEDPDLLLIKTFTSPVAAEKYLNESPNVNLVFLDIEMGELNGVILAERLAHKAKIIITTAYADFAVKGFDLNIIDYLLKPISRERFKRAIEKVRIQIEADQSKKIVSNLKKIAPLPEDSIWLKTDYKLVKIILNQILYIKGAGNYVTIHTLNGKLLVLHTLFDLEQYLLPFQFVRIHKSYLVSFQHVEAIEKNALIIQKETIPIGETYKESFEEFVQQHSHSL